MAFPFIAALGGSVISSIFGARSANKAADAQVQAGREANEVQKYIFDRSVELTEPQREIGLNALRNMEANVASEFSPRITSNTFETDPGYQFRKSEGLNAMSSMAAARGNRMGGDVLREAGQYADNMASAEYGDWWNRNNSEYSDWWNRMAGVAGVGQTATQQQIGAGNTYASAVGNNLNAMGAARASGYQGVNNAIQGGMNNAFTTLGYAQSGMFGANPGFGITPSPAGLSAYGWGS